MVCLQREGGHCTSPRRGRHGGDEKTRLEVRVHVRAVHLPSLQGRRLNFSSFLSVSQIHTLGTL